MSPLLLHFGWAFLVLLPLGFELGAHAAGWEGAPTGLRDLLARRVLAWEPAVPAFEL